MQAPMRHAGVKIISALVGLSLGIGLLAAAATLPFVGAAGVAISDAAKTFNNLPVAGLGQVPARSTMLDSSGHVLAYYYPGYLDGKPHPIYRVPVPFNAISPVMRNAIVAIEDYRYWQHGALDLHGTIRAITTTLSGHTQGGSDIAQQYVKNACVLTATTLAEQQQCTLENVARKLRELRIAANIERTMTRPQLLAAYLNVAYFGNQAYGIDVASELYFSVKPSQLNLAQSALLAGVVNAPSTYDPIANPQNALARRTAVLNAMAQHGYISQATANAAAKQPLGLHASSVPLDTGCIAPSATKYAFFCDYVLSAMRNDPAYHQAYTELQTVGGLTIHTTLNMKDQRAANYAVNYVLPANSSFYNPNHDVDTQVMIQPGTGYIRAIAVNRKYGVDYVNFAVNTPYDGGAGVQTGSSSKVFTLITALKQNIPFGFSLKEKSGKYYGPYYGCHGQYIAPTQFHNAGDATENGTIPLYFGTTASINGFYVALEAKVGLCNVVKTAVSMGMTRADGKSLLACDRSLGACNGNGASADLLPGFTLGEVAVSPMSMAAAYASVDARGVYCHPIAITTITDGSGKSLPVESANCRRVMSKNVADAANYVLQGVLGGTGTAGNRSIGIPAAAKTGTSDHGYYAAFAGYTPLLVSYTSVFNPLHPTTSGAMFGYPNSCYREAAALGGGQSCPGQMFGDNAPGATWETAFLRLRLPARSFPGAPGYYFSMGPGDAPVAPPKHHHGGPHHH